MFSHLSFLMFLCSSYPSPVVSLYSAYSATVPYVYVNMTMQISFGVNNSARLYYDGGLVQWLTSGVSTPLITWPLGAHQFSIHSAQDGYYNFSVVRNTPDVKNISLFGNQHTLHTLTSVPLLSPSHGITAFV